LTDLALNANCPFGRSKNIKKKGNLTLLDFKRVIIQSGPRKPVRLNNDAFQLEVTKESQELGARFLTMVSCHSLRKVVDDILAVKPSERLD
jgi:hypothetical protein